MPAGTGLDLSALESGGPYADVGGDIALVSATQNASGGWVVGGLIAGVSIFGNRPSAAGSIAFSSANNAQQTVEVDPQGANSAGLATQGIAGSTLLGWNADGLLFSNGPDGLDIFVADPGALANANASTGGALPTPGEVFGHNSAVTSLPFGANTINLGCFAAGTLIATTFGNVAVEDLKVGDEVLTASGKARPVIWIGHTTLRPARHPHPQEVHPVRIRAGAFSEGLPVRDLKVSPGHALYVDNMLIPAGVLVNGATIVQEEVESIRYFHVELESHDVLLAEGLPCESYLDDGNRSSFANSDEAIALYGRLDPKSWDEACAPWIDAGPQLAAVQGRLHVRAEVMGWEVSLEPDLHLIADELRVEPLHRHDNRFWFQVPACKSLRLGSRADVLAHVVPGAGDRRRLGVAVADLRVNGASVALSNAQAFGSGFCGLEVNDNHSWRWTDGAAALMLDLDAPTLIEVDLLMVAPSWKRQAPQVRLVKTTMLH